MKRVLTISALACLALKFLFVACAAAPGSFGEFQVVSYNGAEGTLAVSNQTIHLNNAAGDENAATFAFQPFAGSGQIIARIDRSGKTQTKAGLIFRETTNTVSRYAGIFLDGRNIVFERLPNTNELAISTVKTNTAADWLRIVREGDALSGFYSADGSNWIQIGADTVEMRQEIAAGLKLKMGKGNIAFDRVQLNSARLIHPANNTMFTVPTNIWVEAEVKTLVGEPERVEFFVDEKSMGAVSGPPFKLACTNALVGERSITAKIVDLSKAEFFTRPVNCLIKLPARRLTFLGTDSVTMGDWKGIYGKDGYLIPNDGKEIPDFAAVVLSRCKPVTWVDAGADARALEKQASEKRIASTWHSQRAFAIDLDLADGREHRVSLYCLDWDHTGRVQLIEILNPFTGQVLDSRMLASFSEGKYLAWSCNGPVKIRVTPKNGNASISGLFLDPVTNEE